MSADLTMEEAVRRVEETQRAPVARVSDGEAVEELARYVETGRLRGQPVPELFAGPVLVSAKEGAEAREAQPGEVPRVPIREASATKRFLGGAVRDLFAIAEFLAEVMPSAPEAGPGPTLVDTAIRPTRDAVLRTTGLPEEPQGGFAENLGGEVGAALLPGVGTAVRRGRQAVTAGRVATEAGAALGAAGTRTGAQESGAGPGSEIAAGLTGGAAGGTAVRSVGRAVSGATTLGRTLTGTETPRGAEARAREILRENVPSAEARGRAVEGLEQALELQERVPGFQTTLGAASADPNLQALEVDLIRNPDPKSSVGASQVERARLRSSSAVVNAIRDTGPPAGRGTEEVALRRAREMVDVRIRAVDDGIDALRGSRSTDELSRLRRETLESDYQAWSERYGEIYDELDALAARKGVRVPSAPLKRAVAEARRSVGEFEGDLLTPLEPILRQIEELPPSVGFQALRSLKRRINREFREGSISERPLAALSRGTNNALNQIELPVSMNLTVEQRRALAMLRRENPDANLLRDVAERYRQANAGFAEGASIYREGIAGRILAPRSQVGPSQTLDLYFVRGNKGADAAGQYLRSFEGSSEARQDMVDFITRKAAEQAGDSAARLRRFRVTYGPALRAFPEAANRIRNVERLQAAAEELGVTRAAARSPERVQRGAVALFAEDPHLAMRKVLSAPRPDQSMKELVSQMRGDREAIEGLRRIFWDVLETESLTVDPTRTARASELLEGRPLLANGPRMRAFVDQNEASIRVLFGQDMPETLRDLSTAAEMTGAFPSVSVGRVREQGRGPVEEVARSGALSRLGSVRVRAIRTGLTLNRVLRRLSGQEGQRLLRESVLDLRLARTLLSEETSENLRRIRTLMTKRGFTLPARVLGQEEEKQRARSRRDPDSPTPGRTSGLGGP